MYMGSFAVIGTLLRRAEFSSRLAGRMGGADDVIIGQAIDSPEFFRHGSPLGQFAELWSLVLSDYEALMGPVDWAGVRGGYAKVWVDAVQVLGRSEEDRETAIVHTDSYYSGHMSYLVADVLPPIFFEFGRVATRRVDDFLMATLPFLPGPTRLAPYMVARYDGSALHAGPSLCFGGGLSSASSRPWRTRVRLLFQEPPKAAVLNLPSLLRSVATTMSVVHDGASDSRGASGGTPWMPWASMTVSWRVVAPLASDIADAALASGGGLCALGVGGLLRGLELDGFSSPSNCSGGSCGALHLAINALSRKSLASDAAALEVHEMAEYSAMTPPSVLAVAGGGSPHPQKSVERSRMLPESEIDKAWRNSSLHSAAGHHGSAQASSQKASFSCALRTEHGCNWCEPTMEAWTLMPYECLRTPEPQYLVGSTHFEPFGVRLVAAWLRPALDVPGSLLGVHVFGFDLVDHNLVDTELADQPRLCAELCDARLDCTHWLLVPGDYYRAGHLAPPAVLPTPAVLKFRGQCLLKTRDALLLPHAGLLSGTRGCRADTVCVQRDVEYWGGLYRDQRAPTAHMCQRLCQANSYCAYWTYVPMDYEAPPPGGLERVPDLLVSFLRGRCFLKYPPISLPLRSGSLFPGAVAGHRVGGQAAPVPAFDPIWFLGQLPGLGGLPTAVQGAPLLLRPQVDTARRIAFLDERLCLPRDARWRELLRLAIFLSPIGLEGTEHDEFRLRALLLEPLELASSSDGNSAAMAVRVLGRTAELTCPMVPRLPNVCVLDLSGLGASKVAGGCIGWQVGDGPTPIAFSGPEGADALPVWWLRRELYEGEVHFFAGRGLRTYSIQIQFVE